MPPTWIPLLESALRDLALKQDVFVAPQSRCMITDGPEIARFQDGSELDTTHYLVNAILCNHFVQTCDERTFLLPSALPQESLANYSVNLDIDTGIVHVASRFLYVSLKELFLLRKATSPADSTPFVEFFNGKVLAVTSHAGTGTTKSMHIMQDAFQGQGASDSSTAQQKRAETKPNSIATDDVSITARKPFQKKGAMLTVDALASVQQHLLDSAPQTRSPSSGSPMGTDTTPATSATSSNFPLPLDPPKITVLDRQSLCKGAVHASAEDATPLHLMQVIRSAVQDLPAFHIDTRSVSLYYEALDLAQSPSQDVLNDPLASLDLAPSELKEVAYAIQKKFALASPDSPDVEIALDESSGELYLQSIPSKCQSQWSFDMIEIDAMFDDDDDLDLQPVHPIVKLSPAITIHTCMTLEESIVLNTLSLRQALPESTIQVLEKVNIYYRDVWLERYEELNGIPEKNKSKYYEATYDEVLQKQAVAQFELDSFRISKEILELVQPFIVTFLQVWCEGPGGLPNKPDGRWIPGADEPMVNDMTVKLVEWQQIVKSSKQTQLVQLRPGTVAIQEASSPSDWYLQALGGDGQYREHRRVAVADSDGDESENDEGPVHHINFNGTKIHQRSYTPPEVSFWAAATTYDKVLTQKPSLHTKDTNVQPKPLPAVHVARVLTSQAFKWVDPTQYTGHDISALWKKKGSAMRNAATSDVNIVYQQVGTWDLDHFNEDDVTPEIAPDDLNYEYATNGNYRFLQLPYHVYDLSDEHCMINLNVGKQPKQHFHSFATQIRSPTSLLQYELGAELAKKAALLENRMEKRTSFRKPVKFLDVVTEEASTDDEDVNVRQAENASDASTDVGEDIDLDREPVDFVESSGKVEADNSTVAEDRMFQAEDDSSGVAHDLDQEHQFSPKATNVEITVPTLEDGRYLSPSKMVPSRMDLVCTPPQSPSKADDHGSWELDEAGNFVSPSKFQSSIGSLTEDEDDVEEILNLIEDQVNPIFKKTAESWVIVQYPTVQLIGKPSGGDDVFGPVAVHSTFDLTAGDEGQGSRLQNGVSSHLGDPDVDAEISRTYNAIAEKRSQRLRSRVLTEAWDNGNPPDVVEEKESSDGDNAITDEDSTWSGRSDRVSHPKGDIRSRKTKPVKRTNPQEHPKAVFLAQYVDKGPTRKSNRSLSSLVKDGETFIPSTNPGDLALGPKFPNLVVGNCAPADFNDPLIDDVLGILDLDAECATASPHHAVAEDITLAVVSPLKDRRRSLGTASNTESEIPEYNAFSRRTRNLVSILSPIHAGDTEDDSTPIKARKPIAKSKVQRSSQAVQAFRDFCSVRALNTQPEFSDEEFEEILLGRFAQEVKKRSGMTVVSDTETAEHHVSPAGDLIMQTDGTTSNEHHEDSQKSSEGSSPTTSGYQSRASSKQSSGQTSPSSLDSEDMVCMENQSLSIKIPGKLDMNETSPKWMPLANCWKHIAVAVNGLPPKNADVGVALKTTLPQTTPSRVAQGAPRGWKKIGKLQWTESADLRVVPAAGDMVRATNLPNRSSRLPPTRGQIAIAMGSTAIELASWLFWNCMW